MSNHTCYHCGNFFEINTIHIEEKYFCCNGCLSVYKILSKNGLDNYYTIENTPGKTPKQSNYEFLSDEAIEKKLLTFNDGDLKIIEFTIPNMHCSSCIWVLEHLYKLEKGTQQCIVDFNKKTVQIHFVSSQISLQQLAELLDKIGYPPNISMASLESKKQPPERELIYKIAVSGFAFGNIMFLSFPEYFQSEGYWIDTYKYLFRWLSLAFSIPVVFYAAKNYFISAFKGLKAKYLSIDVPISLGILVLFIRSASEVIFNLGSGFFDSLSGLVFFLLLGRFFQQKTYAFLSFERDYKSYFPVSVTLLSENGTEQSTIVSELKKGMKILIRNHEIIPVDCTLLSQKSQLDYGFVTGESHLITKHKGELLFAGGKHLGEAIVVEVNKSVEKSYLTQLWSHSVFKKPTKNLNSKITETVSAHFTLAVVGIAFLASAFWSIYDSKEVLNVLTSVLIIACPCALALASPFALGNVLRIFGRHKLYLKNTNTIEEMALIDTIVFDKTGTLTSTSKTEICYDGDPLSPLESDILKSTLRHSNHPHSRALYKLLKTEGIASLDHYEEVVGQGLNGQYNTVNLKIGSAEYINLKEKIKPQRTGVHISTNNQYRGQFIFENKYRKNISKLFKILNKNYELVILTGDNESERENLEKLLPKNTKILFHQKPIDKLNYIEHHQRENSKVMMIGDGLNDSGALAQSDVGIAISENINVFSPACDGILEASKLEQLYKFIQLSKQTQNVIKLSFIWSFLYNIIGLYYATTAQLTPIVAAILMPLSSISIVLFTTLATNYLGRSLNNLKT